MALTHLSYYHLSVGVGVRGGWGMGLCNMYDWDYDLISFDRAGTTQMLALCGDAYVQFMG